MPTKDQSWDFRAQPFSVNSISLPTNFTTIKSSNDPGAVDRICGCENDKVSSKVVASIQQSLVNPRVFIDHWYAQDELLRTKLSQLHGVEPDQIFLTSGALAAVQHIFDIFVNPESVVGMLRPDFQGFQHYALRKQAKIAWMEKLAFPFQFPVNEVSEFIKESSTDFFIASNPCAVTGTLVPDLEIKQFAQSTDAVVVVDEADILSNESSAKHINDCPNLIIIRSLSKFYGIAAFRVGYIICHPMIARHFANTISPVELTSIALIAANAALDDRDYQRQTQLDVDYNRIVLMDAVSQTPYQLVPDSQCFATYLWAPEEYEDPYETLKRHGGLILKGDIFGLSRGGRINLSSKPAIAGLTEKLLGIKDPKPPCLHHSASSFTMDGSIGH